MKEVIIIEKVIELMNDEIQKKDERIRELEERIKRIESFIGLTPSIIEEISKRDNYR